MTAPHADFLVGRCLLGFDNENHFLAIPIVSRNLALCCASIAGLYKQEDA